MTALAVSACDSSNNGNRNRDFNLQVLHASPDAPAVNVLLNGEVGLEDFDYKDGSGYVVLDEGTYTIQVDGILPGGDATVIGPVDIDFDRDMTYTIAAVNDVLNIEPVILSQSSEDVSAGSARLLALHAAAAAPTVDVYVTTPGADLSASAPIGSFSFKEQIGPAEVAAGDYQIRVTAAGNAAAVVFDSGTIPLADGDDIVVAAVPNTSGGDAPISLVGLTSAGSFEILDIDTPTALRVGHLSSDTGLVDVLVNGGEYLTDVPFGAVTDFDPLPADTYNVAVTAADMPGVVAIGPVDLMLEAGTWYSVLAVDLFSNIEPLIATDDPRPVTTNAKVRIIHAAANPAAASVDIYVTAVGADINAEDPALTDVAFKDNTGYIPLAAGDYDVTVTIAGTKTAAIGPATISVIGGDVFTAIARDPLPGQMDFGLILLADVLP
jgi:hypothetical protein